MYTSVTDLDELHEMRENIRRSVKALEVCWSCQRVSECEQAVVDDAAPVWLCGKCRGKLHGLEPTAPRSFFWPSPW